MRKIEYTFIDSDTERCDSASGKPNSLEISRAQAVSSNAQNNNCKSGHRAIPNLGYHFVVNSEGLVLNPTGISIPAHIIQGPVYDPDKYNDCSIFIRYCGSIRPEAWLMQSGTSCSTIMAQRAALLQLLVDLRQHFPDAKILGVSEIDGRELYCKNIIVSDAMNVLRKELSNLL